MVVTPWITFRMRGTRLRSYFETTPTKVGLNKSSVCEKEVSFGDI